MRATKLMVAFVVLSMLAVFIGGGWISRQFARADGSSAAGQPERVRRIERAIAETEK